AEGNSRPHQPARLALDRGSPIWPTASTRTTEGRPPYYRLLRARSSRDIARAAAAAERVAYIRHAPSIAFGARQSARTCIRSDPAHRAKPSAGIDLRSM